MLPLLQIETATITPLLLSTKVKLTDYNQAIYAIDAS